MIDIPDAVRGDLLDVFFQPLEDAVIFSIATDDGYRMDVSLSVNDARDIAENILRRAVPA